VGVEEGVGVSLGAGVGVVKDSLVIKPRPQES